MNTPTIPAIGRRSTALDLAVVATVAAAYAVATQAWLRARPDVAGGTLLRLGLFLGLSVVPLWWRRSHPAAVAGITAAGFLLWQEPLAFPASPFGLLVAAYSLGAWAPRRTALLTAGVGLPVVTAYLLSRVATADATSLVDVATFVPTVAVLWGAGMFVRSRRDRTRALEQRAADAERSREARAAEAVAAERRRIARELHDVVAHHVTVMTIQAGAARRVLTGDPASAAEAIARVETAGREALVEMRRLLGVLRNPDDRAAHEPQPGVAAIGDLVERAKANGHAVTFTVDGAPRPLAPGVELAAYRVVQEALTNVAKHAGDASTTVQVRYATDAIEIEVVDDGSGRVDAIGDGGHGLLGMRERVSVFGGRLEAGPRVGGGFTVRAVLPAEDER